MSRVVHVGDSTSSLTVRHQQLVAENRCDSDGVRTAPLEDLDLIVLSTLNGLDLDLHVLQRAVEHRTGMVICDESFQPAGILLPLFGAWNHTEVLHAQMASSLPRRKRAWQQVIRQKIRQQALSIDEEHPAHQRLVHLAERVRSGDSTNTEATAARVYWPALMGSGFRRIPRTRAGVNGALDYGYAIVRSLVARCIAGVGLHPALGVHHQSRSNPLCLADDLVEPLRPFVDRLVSARRDMFLGDLEPDGKIVLRGLLDLPVGCGDHRGLLTTACERYIESFRGYLLGEDEGIEFPEVLDQ